MALEAGIMALKMAYKLAKMIKEARDNVLFIRAKLDSTTSTESVIEHMLEHLDPKVCPDGVADDIKGRLAQHRRATRRMRLKYEPLMTLLSNLGGSAAVIKAQASMMSKGILGCTMTLGSVSVLVRRHIERLEKRAADLKDKVKVYAAETKDKAQAAAMEQVNAVQITVQNAQKTATDRASSIQKIAMDYGSSLQQTVGNISKQSQKIQASAQQQSSLLLETAKKNAAILERQAHEKAQAMVNHARQESDKLRQQCQIKAVAMVGKARNALEIAKDEERLNAEQRLRQAQGESEEMIRTGNTKATAMITRAQETASKLLADASAQAQNITNVAGNESERIIKLAEQQMDEIQKQLSGTSSSMMSGMGERMQGESKRFQEATLARGNSLQQQSMNQIQSMKNQTMMEKDRLQQAAKDKVKGLLAPMEGSADKLKEMYKTVYVVLDQIDLIVRELKEITAKSEHKEEPSHAWGGEDAKGVEKVDPMDMVPTHVGTDGIHEVEQDTSGCDHLIEQGIRTIIEKWMRMSEGGSADDGSTILDDSVLNQMFAGNASPALINLFKRQLGTTNQHYEQILTSTQLTSYLIDKCKYNLGIGVASLCQTLVNLLSEAKLPSFVDGVLDIAKTIAESLIKYAFSFGLLLAGEELREQVQDDPEEIAARESEQDEENLARRMELISLFAADFKDSFEHGTAPDPSLIVAIAIEAMASFSGLGPTVMRRVKILISVMQIANVEADKKIVEQVDHDLRSELNLVNTLTGPKQLGSLTETFLQDRAVTYDIRKELGEGGEVVDFWCQSFGYQCYEVPWTRFRIAHLKHYGEISDKALRRMKLMLLDHRGQVTLDHVKAFAENSGGSLSGAVKVLSRLKNMPTHIADLTGNNTNNMNGMTKTMQKAMSMRNRSPSMTRATTSIASSSSFQGGWDNSEYDDDHDLHRNSLMTGIAFDSDEGSMVGPQHISKHFSASEKSFFPAVKGSPQSLSLLSNGNGNSGYTPGIFTAASNGHGGLTTPGIFVTSASGMTSGEILKAAGEGNVSPEKAFLFEEEKSKKKGGVLSGLTPTLSPTERRQAKLRLLGTANNA